MAHAALKPRLDQSTGGHTGHAGSKEHSCFPFACSPHNASNIELLFVRNKLLLFSTHRNSAAFVCISRDYYGTPLLPVVNKIYIVTLTPPGSLWMHD